VFRDPPIKIDSGSMANQACMEFTAKFLKIIAYLVTFVLVLTGGVIAKGSILFMSAQLKRDRKIVYCNKDLARDKQFLAILPEEERIAWIWVVMIAYAVPEIGVFIRSARICFFKTLKVPTKSHFLFVFLMETVHVVGLVLLVFVVLPELDSVKAAMLTNCLCVIPGMFGLLSRTSKEGRRAVKCLVDLAAIAAQVTGFVVWPLLENRPVLWLIPVAAFMISCGWWENYVSPQSPFGLIRAMGRVKDELKFTRYFTYMFLSVWKMAVLLCGVLLMLMLEGTDPANLFLKFSQGFGPHKIVVEEIATSITQLLPDIAEATHVSFC
jgi:chitin synthase